MPIARSPMFDVPESEVESILQEVEIRVEAKKRVKATIFNPELGSTAEEAEARIKEIRADIGLYGEYVYGLKPADVHTLWNQIASDVIYRRVRQNKVLFIAPPNSAKSTWNSLIRVTYHLGLHPDQSLLFFTSSDPMAKIFHSPVESALRESTRHKDIFPDNACRPNIKRGWSTDGLYLRGVPPAQKDPSYKAVGFGATIMGARAHGVIVDDPLNQDEAESEIVQAGAKRYSDRTVTPRIQIPDGWMLAVMTRFHENDLASHYIKLAEESGDWIYVRTPLVATNSPEPDPLGRQTGDRLWPERFTEAYVENEKLRFTIAEFNLVQQGDPTGIGGDIFESENWFQPLPENFWSDILPTCFVVQSWDLAFSEKKRSCYTVGLSVAVDPEFNIYIIHVVRKQYNLLATSDVMTKSIQVLHPVVVGVETEGFHKNTIEALARRVLSNVMCNIQLVKADKDKVSRARLPAARGQHGKLFINRKADWYWSFVSECLGFPNTRYKDQVDALSLATYMIEKLEASQTRVDHHVKRKMLQYALE